MASARVARHDGDAVDHHAEQIPPLLKVSLHPERTRIGLKDDALLGGGIG